MPSSYTLYDIGVIFQESHFKNAVSCDFREMQVVNGLGRHYLLLLLICLAVPAVSCDMQDLVP